MTVVFCPAFFIFLVLYYDKHNTTTKALRKLKGRDGKKFFFLREEDIKKNIKRDFLDCSKSISV